MMAALAGLPAYAARLKNMIGTGPFGVILFDRMQRWITAAIYRQSYRPAMAHFCGGIATFRPNPRR